jgi:uncharacterized iron-regulated membrane protein
MRSTSRRARHVHEIVFLIGVFPLVFAVTGVIMWWRGRRRRRDVAAGRAAGRGELQAAE